MYQPRTISSQIDKIAREALGKDWTLYAALLDHWTEIVGADYARVTTPVKITFPPRQHDAQRTGGTLIIRLPKGLAMEFTFKIGQIRERINAYFGYEPISKIVFESIYGANEQERPEPKAVDPEKLQAVRDAAKDIENSELRDALEAFGETVLKNLG